jgi:hypothetical protein
MGEEDKGRGGERACVVILDLATRWLAAYPVANKSADEGYASFLHFVGPKEAVKSFCSDNSPELMRAAKDMGWPHPTSTPGRHGVAERAVRTASEGAATLLMHAGLPECWWPQAMKYISVARNFECIEGLSGEPVRRTEAHRPAHPLRCVG